MSTISRDLTQSLHLAARAEAFLVERTLGVELWPTLLQIARKERLPRPDSMEFPHDSETPWGPMRWTRGKLIPAKILVYDKEKAAASTPPEDY